MRFAYADPPYPRQARKHYEDHPDYAGEVDHPALIERLTVEYPDGWALSTNPGELHWLLPLCPPHRVLAWVKPFASWKKGVYPFYAWEPVVMVGGRNGSGILPPVRDYIAAIPPIFTKSTDDPTRGEKPFEFCLWLFACFGAIPDDTVDDLFPGSGVVGRAWGTYCAQVPVAVSTVPTTDELWALGDNPGTTTYEGDAA